MRTGEVHLVRGSRGISHHQVRFGKDSKADGGVRKIYYGKNDKSGVP